MHTPSSGTPSRANSNRRRRGGRPASNGAPSSARTAAATAPAHVSAAPAMSAAALDAAEFADYGLSPRIIDALAGLGATRPFPIQAATLPDSLAGRDVLGRGRTGSGKTIAFALPIVARLAASGRRAAPGTAARPGARPHP